MLTRKPQCSSGKGLWSVGGGFNVSFFYVLICMYCTAAVVQVGRKQDVIVSTVSKQPPVQVGRAVLFNQSWYRLPAVAGYLTFFFSSSF